MSGEGRPSTSPTRRKRTRSCRATSRQSSSRTSSSGRTLLWLSRSVLRELAHLTLLSRGQVADPARGIAQHRVREEEGQDGAHHVQEGRDGAEGRRLQESRRQRRLRRAGVEPLDAAREEKARNRQAHHERETPSCGRSLSDVQRAYFSPTIVVRWRCADNLLARMQKPRPQARAIPQSKPLPSSGGFASTPAAARAPAAAIGRAPAAPVSNGAGRAAPPPPSRAPAPPPPPPEPEVEMYKACVWSPWLLGVRSWLTSCWTVQQIHVRDGPAGRDGVDEGRARRSGAAGRRW